MRRFDFAILVVLLLLMNVWFLEKPYITTHDTSQRFEMFYFFYNNYFWHGTLAQWVPYYSYGVPSSYWQLFTLTPASYFLMVIGKFFAVKDAYLVFKYSMLAEQLIFLLGMYLLSTKLFKDRLTIGMVCLGSMASSYWYDQIDFAFRMYYLFPMVVYFFVRFLEEKKGELFWFSGLMFLAWAMGNLLYSVFIWVPLLSFLFCYLSFKTPKILTCLFQPTFKNISLFLLFASLSFCFFYELKTFSDFVNVLYRSAEVKNNLETFLTYGQRQETLQGILNDLFYGQETGVYVGILPMLAFIWGIFNLRSRPYIGFLFSALGVMWLSFGGWGAAILYFFPGVPYYRHVGHLYGLIKVLVVLTAGFGLDYFWTLKIKDQIVLIALTLGTVLFCSDGFGLSQWWLLENFVKHHSSVVYWGQEPWDSAFFRAAAYVLVLGDLLLVYFLTKGNVSRTRVKVLLLLAFCFDIYSFQYANYRSIADNRLLPKDVLYTLNVHRDEYQQQRAYLRDKRTSDVLDVLNMGTVYTTVYSVTQSEPCQTQFRKDFQPKNTKLLEDYRRFQIQDLQKVSGCATPKLRLVAPWVSYNKPEEVSRMPGWYDTVVLKDAIIDEDHLPKPSKPCLNCPDIQVNDFSADELAAQVNAPAKGAWLVYADSFHPGWHAVVNGSQQPVYQANLAFKAVYLKGPSTVKLYFRDGINFYFSYIMMAFGIICILFFLWLFATTLTCP